MAKLYQKNCSNNSQASINVIDDNNLLLTDDKVTRTDQANNISQGPELSLKIEGDPGQR